MDASSYDAYKTLVAQGKLGKLQRQVIVKLMEAGPQTGRELNARLGIPDAHKRLSELERKGLVETDSEAVCSITLRKSKVWKVCWHKIPSNPIRHISTEPQKRLDNVGIKSVLDVKTGPTIYAAIVDGLPLKASASKTKIMDYCKATGIPMVKFRPERIWEFHPPKTTAGTIFGQGDLFPGHEG